MEPVGVSETIEITDVKADKVARTSNTAENVSSGLYQRIFKRFFDLVLAFALLPIIAPVIGILAVLVMLDGGPAFFGQVRVGQGRKHFRCWKIRTMMVNAEARLQDMLSADPELAAKWQRDYKLDPDPRITPIGRFLRETSLDELPQIWNVIIGEMSFVGPRPVVPSEIKKYGANEWAYLSCVPGVTGLWQVSGRNDVSYDERVQMDVKYLKKRSLLMDLSILGMTVNSVVNKTGS